MERGIITLYHPLSDDEKISAIDIQKMNYKKYNNYSIEDFADDTDFKNWVRRPNARHQTHWQMVLAQHPNLESKIEAAKKIVLELDKQFEQDLPDDAAPDPHFAKLLTAIVSEQQQTKDRALIKPKVHRRWAIAATIALLLSVGLWFLSTEQEVPNAEWVIHKTEFGEWKELTLPDGSIVHLNAHSELRLKDNWEEVQDRQVWLTGEAFFEVAKKPVTNAKFRVITEALQVEVLGTTFNVKAKGDNTKVFLEEGKIQLKAAAQSLILQPNDFIDYSAGQQLLPNTQKMSKEATISWKDGTLLLTQVTVEEILERLEEIYGYSFVVEQKEILTQRKTLAVPMDNIAVISPILERVLDVKIAQKGTQLTLIKK